MTKSYGDAPRAGRDRRVEEHDAVPGQPLARRLREDRPAAEGQHAVVVRECLGDRILLERAEGGLTVVEEDLRDRLAGHGLDIGVGVAGRCVPGLGEQGPHGGLAGAHGADQDDPRAHLNLRVSR
jgi:hypothetical protein